MHPTQVLFKVVFLLKNFRADATLKSSHANVVNVSHVLLQVAFLRTDFRAECTLKGLDVTNTVNSSHVQTHMG